jgi:hypothetical protein
MRHWQSIAENLSQAGFSWGCVSSTDHKGRQIWVVAAERSDTGDSIVPADELLTARLELESVDGKAWEPESGLRT